MHDKIRIDLSTGLMIDIVSPYETGDDIIETPCNNSFYLPKWDGTQWVEGGTAPNVTMTVDSLKAELNATDYKIIKCAEYQLAGIDPPYDISELHTVRQALRDQINKLESAQ